MPGQLSSSGAARPEPSPSVRRCGATQQEACPGGLAMRTTIASLTLIALAPAFAAAVAQAQTSVTRQITREQVETVVTQGPNGVAVSRRILSPEPGISTYLQPP